MNPDPKKYFLLESVVLQKAGIIADSCNHSVDEAEAMNIPGHTLARRYLEQLESEFYARKTDKIVEGVDDSFDLYIEKEYAIAWMPDNTDLLSIPPVTSGFQKGKVKRHHSKHDKPTARSTLLILGVMVYELGYYKKYDEQGRKGGQIATLEHLEELIEKYLSSNKSLSRSSIRDNLKCAMDEFMN